MQSFVLFGLILKQNTVAFPNCLCARMFEEQLPCNKTPYLISCRCIFVIVKTYHPASVQDRLICASGYELLPQ